MADLGPMDRAQLSYVAREYFVKGKSKVQIAASMKISRFKVARMIEDAVEKGVIKFQIDVESTIDYELSKKLQCRFNLKDAVVVNVPAESEDCSRKMIATAASQYLIDLLSADDVLGVTSGRTLNAMAREVPALNCRELVQMAGSAGTIEQSGIEVMRRLSSLSSVEPWPIYGSLLMSDVQAADGMRRQPDIQAAFKKFSEITVGLFAIGSWIPQNSVLLENPVLSKKDREELLRQGVVAEIAAILVTDSGGTVDSIKDRCIAISEDEIRAIPIRIGIAGGPQKTRAIRAVLTSGLLTNLITDCFTAERLIVS